MELTEIVQVKFNRSDGRTLSLESGSWGITSITGIEFPSIELFTADKGIGNGSILTGKRKTSRDIEISAKQRVRRNNLTSFISNRSQVLGFFNPNYSFDLVMTVLGQTKIAKACEIQSASYQTVNGEDFSPTLTVKMLSLDSDLYGTDEANISFVNTKALWHDTRVYTLGGGTQAFGLIELATTQQIDYEGSEEAPITIEVIASGLVEGITVTLNGTTLTVSQELTEGDKLVIDTGERTITLNGKGISEDLIDTVTLSTMMLQVGDNTLSVESDGNTAFSASVQYTGRYGGIYD